MGGRGSHGGRVTPKGGLFPLPFFKPRPVGGEFKTEEGIVNWFKERGVDNIGHVEIDPEPEDYLHYDICRLALKRYAEGIRECKSEGHNCAEFFHVASCTSIQRLCAIRIVPPPTD